MTNESETIEQVFERCTSTDFSSRDREEILKAMQEYADIQNQNMERQLRELVTFLETAQLPLNRTQIMNTVSGIIKNFERFR